MDHNNPSKAKPAPDPNDWRSHLEADSRGRIVNKIMETLKRHIPFYGQEGLNELRKIAVRFEEKIYAAATSQSDYLQKISLKLLTMEPRSQTNNASSLLTNSSSQPFQEYYVTCLEDLNAAMATIELCEPTNQTSTDEPVQINELKK